MKTKPALISLLILFSFGCTQSSEQNSITDNPAKTGSRYPYLFSSQQTLYMSWISKTGNKNALQYARYRDGKWSRSRTIASDSTWFVNWADYPSIIADRHGPVAAHWLDKKSGGTYAYDVNISTAESANKWHPPITPHLDSTATEHGFVSMTSWDDTTFLAVWLDGRQTAGRSGDEYYNINKAMSLRGALISTTGEIQKKFLIDKSVCDCCNTSLVKTKNGAIVAYRNRTSEEIRDIYVSRFDGDKWSQPQAVHSDGWKIGACPVNGPELAANGSKVAVAWYTAANDSAVTKVAVSSDNGRQFNAPVTVNKDESQGRVDVAALDHKTYVSWMEKTENRTQLMVSSLDDKQQKIKTLPVGIMNSSRRSGFPQMERLGNRLIFAWTAPESSATQIKTKSVSLPFR